MLHAEAFPQTHLAIRGERLTGIVRLTVSGTLDTSTAPTLEREVQAFAVPGGALILDLEGLIGVDGAGLNVLLRARERSSRDEWRFSIVNFNDAVRESFEAVGGGQSLCDADDLRVLDGGDGEWSPIALPSFLGQPTQTHGGNAHRVGVLSVQGTSAPSNNQVAIDHGPPQGAWDR